MDQGNRVFNHIIYQILTIVTVMNYLLKSCAFKLNEKTKQKVEL